MKRSDNARLSQSNTELDMAKKRPVKKKTPKTRPRIRFVVVADAAARDPNGKVTLYGLFSKIVVSELPSKTPSIVIAASLVGGSGEGTLTFDVVSPSGESCLKEKPEFPVKLEPTGVDIALQLPPFDLQEDGEYNAVIRFENRKLTPTCPFWVQLKNVKK